VKSSGDTADQGQASVLPFHQSIGRLGAGCHTLICTAPSTNLDSLPPTNDSLRRSRLAAGELFRAGGERHAAASVVTTAGRWTALRSVPRLDYAYCRKDRKKDATDCSNTSSPRSCCCEFPMHILESVFLRGSHALHDFPLPLVQRGLVVNLDLKCPSCSSDNTQRLSVMHGQQSVKGTIGAGQTVLAASFQEPKKPWASTIGFFIALCTLPIFSAFSGSGSPIPVVGFLVVWLGIRFWMNQDYERKFRQWQNKLDENFICLRCGNIFSTPSEMGHLAAKQRREEESPKDSLCRYGWCHSCRASYLVILRA
jgi:hypothetical protein